MVYQLDIYRILHPTIQSLIFFQNTYRIILKIDHMYFLLQCKEVRH